MGCVLCVPREDVSLHTVEDISEADSGDKDDNKLSDLQSEKEIFSSRPKQRNYEAGLTAKGSKSGASQEVTEDAVSHDNSELQKLSKPKNSVSREEGRASKSFSSISKQNGMDFFHAKSHIESRARVSYKEEAKSTHGNDSISDLIPAPRSKLGMGLGHGILPGSIIGSINTLDPSTSEDDSEAHSLYAPADSISIKEGSEHSQSSALNRMVQFDEVPPGRSSSKVTMAQNSLYSSTDNSRCGLGQKYNTEGFSSYNFEKRKVSNSSLILSEKDEMSELKTLSPRIRFSDRSISQCGWLADRLMQKRFLFIDFFPTPACQLNRNMLRSICLVLPPKQLLLTSCLDSAFEAQIRHPKYSLKDEFRMNPFREQGILDFFMSGLFFENSESGENHNLKSSTPAQILRRLNITHRPHSDKEHGFDQYLAMHGEVRSNIVKQNKNSPILSRGIKPCSDLMSMPSLFLTELNCYQNDPLLIREDFVSCGKGDTMHMSKLSPLDTNLSEWLGREAFNSLLPMAYLDLFEMFPRDCLFGDQSISISENVSTHIFIPSSEVSIIMLQNKILCESLDSADKKQFNSATTYSDQLPEKHRPQIYDATERLSSCALFSSQVIALLATYKPSRTSLSRLHPSSRFMSSMRGSYDGVALLPSTASEKGLSKKGSGGSNSSDSMKSYVSSPEADFSRIWNEELRDIMIFRLMLHLAKNAINMVVVAFQELSVACEVPIFTAECSTPMYDEYGQILSETTANSYLGIMNPAAPPFHERVREVQAIIDYLNVGSSSKDRISFAESNYKHNARCHPPTSTSLELISLLTSHFNMEYLSRVVHRHLSRKQVSCISSQTLIEFPLAIRNTLSLTAEGICVSLLAEHALELAITLGRLEAQVSSFKTTVSPSHQIGHSKRAASPRIILSTATQNHRRSIAIAKVDENPEILKDVSNSHHEDALDAFMFDTSIHTSKSPLTPFTDISTTKSAPRIATVPGFTLNEEHDVPYRLAIASNIALSNTGDITNQSLHPSKSQSPLSSLKVLDRHFSNHGISEVSPFNFENYSNRTHTDAYASISTDEQYKVKPDPEAVAGVALAAARATIEALLLPPGSERRQSFQIAEGKSSNDEGVLRKPQRSSTQLSLQTNGIPNLSLIIESDDQVPASTMHVNQKRGHQLVSVATFSPSVPTLQNYVQYGIGSARSTFSTSRFVSHETESALPDENHTSSFGISIHQLESDAPKQLSKLYEGSRLAVAGHLLLNTNSQSAIDEQASSQIVGDDSFGIPSLSLHGTDEQDKDSYIAIHGDDERNAILTFKERRDSSVANRKPASNASSQFRIRRSNPALSYAGEEEFHADSNSPSSSAYTLASVPNAPNVRLRLLTGEGERGGLQKSTHSSSFILSKWQEDEVNNDSSSLVGVLNLDSSSRRSTRPQSRSGSISQVLGENGSRLFSSQSGEILQLSHNGTITDMFEGKALIMPLAVPQEEDIESPDLQTPVYSQIGMLSPQSIMQFTPNQRLTVEGNERSSNRERRKGSSGDGAYVASPRAILDVLNHPLELPMTTILPIVQFNSDTQNGSNGIDAKHNRESDQFPFIVTDEKSESGKKVLPNPNDRISYGHVAYARSHGPTTVYTYEGDPSQCFDSNNWTASEGGIHQSSEIGSEQILSQTKNEQLNGGIAYNKSSDNHSDVELQDGSPNCRTANLLSANEPSNSKTHSRFSASVSHKLIKSPSSSDVSKAFNFINQGSRMSLSNSNTQTNNANTMQITSLPPLPPTSVPPTHHFSVITDANHTHYSPSESVQVPSPTIQAASTGDDAHVNRIVTSRSVTVVGTTSAAIQNMHSPTNLTHGGQGKHAYIFSSTPNAYGTSLLSPTKIPTSPFTYQNANLPLSNSNSQLPPAYPLSPSNTVKNYHSYVLASATFSATPSIAGSIGSTGSDIVSSPAPARRRLPPSQPSTPVLSTYNSSARTLSGQFERDMLSCQQTPVSAVGETDAEAAWERMYLKANPLADHFHSIAASEKLSDNSSISTSCISDGDWEGEMFIEPLDEIEHGLGVAVPVPETIIEVENPIDGSMYEMPCSKNQSIIPAQIPRINFDRAFALMRRSRKGSSSSNAIVEGRGLASSINVWPSAAKISRIKHEESCKRRALIALYRERLFGEADPTLYPDEVVENEYFRRLLLSESDNRKYDASLIGSVGGEFPSLYTTASSLLLLDLARADVPVGNAEYTQSLKKPLSSVESLRIAVHTQNFKRIQRRSERVIKTESMERRHHRIEEIERQKEETIMKEIEDYLKQKAVSDVSQRGHSSHRTPKHANTSSNSHSNSHSHFHSHSHSHAHTHTHPYPQSYLHNQSHVSTSPALSSKNAQSSNRMAGSSCKSVSPSLARNGSTSSIGHSSSYSNLSQRNANASSDYSHQSTAHSHQQQPHPSLSPGIYPNTLMSPTQLAISGQHAQMLALMNASGFGSRPRTPQRRATPSPVPSQTYSNGKSNTRN